MDAPYRAYLICYDIADPKRLRRVATLLEQHGTRVQKSVFVCRLTDRQVETLVRVLRRRLDLCVDAVSVYPICLRCEAAALHLGTAFTAPPVPLVLIA